MKLSASSLISPHTLSRSAAVGPKAAIRFGGDRKIDPNWDERLEAMFQTASHGGEYFQSGTAFSLANGKNIWFDPISKLTIKIHSREDGAKYPIYDITRVDQGPNKGFFLYQVYKSLDPKDSRLQPTEEDLAKLNALLASVVDAGK